MRRDLTRSVVVGVGVGVLACGLPSNRAQAQNALGDGTVLDSNLRVGSGGRNEPTRDFRSELEFRNAIVTGNVAGGKAFRGEVGYSAVDDFRSNLGSNDLFQFQRESFYSGLATRGLGLGALESSLAYSVAGQSSSYFGGQLIINRSGTHTSAGEVTGAEAQMVRTDVYGNVAGTMRSPSQQILRRAEQAELVAYTQANEQHGAMVVSASPLLGVKTLPSSSIVVDAGRRFAEEWGEEEAEPEPEERRTSPHQRLLNALERSGEQIELSRQETRVAPGLARTLEAETELAEGEAPEDAQAGVQPPPPAQPAEAPSVPGLEELRRVLERGRLIDAWGRSTFSDDLALEEGTPGEEPDELPQPGEQAEEAEEDEDADSLARRVFGIEVPTIDQLTTSLTSEDVFDRHMRRGEELLGEARWFHAEERFTAALAIIPGDPMAAAGRVHAQLGAGMYLSAAVNLRNLFRAHPEFIPVRFDQKLLPRGDRLEVLEGQLRQRVERDTPIGRDAAFLMAYLGHQYEDSALVEEGFDALERIESGLGVETDPLHEATRAVWLKGSE